MSLNSRFKLAIVLVLLGSALLVEASAAAGASISGRVVNQSTGKPGSGDDVILLRLGEGMEEAERTRADSQGVFSFSTSGSGADYIVRVMHHGVNYDQRVVDAASPMEIVVYDAAARVSGLAGTMGMAQVESDGRNLTVTEMYAIRNDSNPPVTKANPRNFEISLPGGAALDSFQVKRAGGVWVNASPAPVDGMKRRYAVDFPLRPGETLFEFVYHLPMQKRTALKVKLAYPVRTFGVVHPPSIVFSSSTPKAFTSPGVIKGLQLEQLVSEEMIRDVPVFELSGVGAAPSQAQLAQATRPLVQPAVLSPALPSQVITPAAIGDKPRSEFWVILSCMSAFLTAGFVFLVRRRRDSSSPASAGDMEDEASIIDAIKDELSQLEMEKLYGAISPEEYESARQAVNVSLQRVLARSQN